MQPGAESPGAVAACRLAGINVIADGSCVLKFLGFDNNWLPAQGASYL